MLVCHQIDAVGWCPEGWVLRSVSERICSFWHTFRVCIHWSEALSYDRNQERTSQIWNLYVTPCILIRYQYIGSTDSWNNADLSIFYTSGYKFGRSLSIANNPVIWYFIFCCWVSVEVHDRRIHDVWRSEELWCCAFQRTKRHITIIISLVADVKRDEAYSKILISRCVLPLW